MRKALSILAFTVILALAAAYAGERAEPQLSMFPNICTAELRAMMDKENNLVVVDARKTDRYYRGHLPGAINVPPKKLDQIANFLPEEKATPVVFYSGGFG